jgi:YggT family protein
MDAAAQVAEGLIFFFIACLWARFVVDWVLVFARNWQPRGPVLLVLEAVFTLTDPPIRAVRRILPAPRIRGIALDFSLLVVLLLAYVLRAVVHSFLL